MTVLKICVFCSLCARYARRFSRVRPCLPGQECRSDPECVRKAAECEAKGAAFRYCRDLKAAPTGASIACVTCVMDSGPTACLHCNLWECEHGEDRGRGGMLTAK